MYLYGPSVQVLVLLQQSIVYTYGYCIHNEFFLVAFDVAYNRNRHEQHLVIMLQTLKFFAVMCCFMLTEDGHGATEQGGYGT